ncbi:MAG: glycosyltransferase [Lentisphaeria bacterium]|nr:glycosyltransferase [Lentisphaeria bacterium]
MKNDSFMTKSKELTCWGILALMVLFFFLIDCPENVYNAIMDNDTILTISLISAGISIMTLAFLLLTAVIAYTYKPLEPMSEEKLPGCTVIVPAYNEGEHVAETIQSLLLSNYPAERLEIIAINDGSKDDTWEWIKYAASKSHGLVKAINLIQNGGKKHALYVGIKEAKHDFIVTVDSDSIVDRNALRNMVAPFADEKVGGVAGNIRVKNLEQGFIPLMLDIGFVFGFEFMRCAQSMVGSVFCTPGALSAYRKSAIMPCLDEWLNQTFLGVPSHIGEDRAITSLLLCRDYKVVFQSNAVADTCVPDNYPQLCKMLLRWTRSDFRENLVMSKFVYRHYRWNFSWVMLQINLMAQILGILLPVIFVPLFFYTLYVFADNMFYMLYSSCMLTFVWSGISAIIYAKRYSPIKSVWAFVYGLYGTFALSWICPYSFFTMRNSKWLTREKKSTPARHSSFRYLMPSLSTIYAMPRKLWRNDKSRLNKD